MKRVDRLLLVVCLLLLACGALLAWVTSRPPVSPRHAGKSMVDGVSALCQDPAIMFVSFEVSAEDPLLEDYKALPCPNRIEFLIVDRPTKIVAHEKLRLPLVPYRTRVIFREHEGRLLVDYTIRWMDRWSFMPPFG